MWTIFSVAALLMLWRTIMRFCIFIYKSDEKMTGKVVIVTGANSGIGFQVALELARRGARVILACRNDARGNAAREQIVAATGNHLIVYKHLDLASLASVRAFADDISRSETKLDVLVNNAGVYGFGERYTEDGIVEGMQVNHYGQFLLTELLLPMLKKSRPSRIVNVTSLLHFLGTPNVKHFNEKGYYSDLRIYCNSKLCNMACSVDLASTLKDSGVVVNTVHPGTVQTNICENASKATVANFVAYILFRFLCWLCYRDAWEGAQTVLQLCIDPTLANVSGKFFIDGVQWPYSWFCYSRKIRDKVVQNCEDMLNGKVRNGIKVH